VFDACTTNALESGAVVDVCHCFSTLHIFSSRLFIFRLLLSSDSQTLPNKCNSGPTVARNYPCSRPIGMSCDPRRRSSVFMTENCISTVRTFAAMSICESPCSLKNSVISRLSRGIRLCSHTLTSLSQIILALRYVNTKPATG